MAALMCVCRSPFIVMSQLFFSESEQTKTMRRSQHRLRPQHRQQYNKAIASLCRLVTPFQCERRRARARDSRRAYVCASMNRPADSGDSACVRKHWHDDAMNIRQKTTHTHRHGTVKREKTRARISFSVSCHRMMWTCFCTGCWQLVHTKLLLAISFVRWAWNAGYPANGIYSLEDGFHALFALFSGPKSVYFRPRFIDLLAGLTGSSFLPFFALWTNFCYLLLCNPYANGQEYAKPPKTLYHRTIPLPFTTIQAYQQKKSFENIHADSKSYSARVFCRHLPRYCRLADYYVCI